MTGYATKSIWKENRWSKTQLLDPYPVCVESAEDIAAFLSPGYGIYKICEASEANTLFRIEDEEGNTLDYCFAKEQLPWED